MFPHTLELSNGRKLHLPPVVPKEGSHGPIFTMSIRKSGSTMLTYLSSLLAKEAGYGFFDVGDWLFQNNVFADSMHHETALCKILMPGIVYSGFRDYPTILRKERLFYEAPRLLFIRDPRDALVSEYFSNRATHMLPNSTGEKYDDNSRLMEKLRDDALKTSIDEFVLDRAPFFEATAKHLYPEILAKTALVLKYEDYIFSKLELVKIVAHHCGLIVSQNAMQVIANEIDLRPPVENPNEFVRRVTPGDHKEKLSPATISKLNTILSTVLLTFGYK